MICILDHFFRIWPWLLSHFTAFESSPKAYSQFLLYHLALENPENCRSTVSLGLIVWEKQVGVWEVHGLDVYTCLSFLLICWQKLVNV